MRTYEVSCGVKALRGKSRLNLTFNRQLIEAASKAAAPGALLAQVMREQRLDEVELANEPVVNEVSHPVHNASVNQ